MAGDCSPGGPDLKQMGEEELWDLINDNRHRISLDVQPGICIPYLRQARVLTEIDQDEILTCHNLVNRCMRTSHMLDLLRTQGRNGAVALLESLMIHYPRLYTKVTGHKPSTEPSRFSGLMKYSELTEYLVKALAGMQNELQEAHAVAKKMVAHCKTLESEISQLMEHKENSTCLQAENQRLQRAMSTSQREIIQLKEEKCDLYRRYTAAIEERSAVNDRLHELNLQLYQLQTELQNAKTKSEFQKQLSLRSSPPTSTPWLQLAKDENLDPGRRDVMKRELAEAINSQMELEEQLKRYREESEQLMQDKEALLEQKQSLSLQVKQLTVDWEMLQQKNTMIQDQTRDLQAERDQAYVSRDEAQVLIARILVEKDELRSRVLQLQDNVLHGHKGQIKDKQSSKDSEVKWERPSREFAVPCRRQLCRMDAVNPMLMSFSNVEYEVLTGSSVPSRDAEPPSSESLRRREQLIQKDSSAETTESDTSFDDFVLIQDDEGKEGEEEEEGGGEEELTTTPSSSRSCSSNCVSKSSAPPFLVRSRPKAIRVNGRVLSISFQGEALFSQLTVVGGNKTGVFVHRVKEGSAAHTVGISPGAQIVELKYEQNQKALRMVLEDSTLEEATWALSQVSGLCHLSLRPKQDEYTALLQQLQSGQLSSGDSFYVRVNMSLAAGPNETLSVSCNDILHVTNTRPAGAEDSWHACQVHPNELHDLKSGNVPNYYRAQRLLIRIIEDMSFQTNTSAKDAEDLEKKKMVRIVGTGRQGRNPLWVSVEEEPPKSTESGDTCAPKSCMTLMPYTLVTPHFPPTCRPILLLPTVLGRVLGKKVSRWQGFELCEPEVLSSSQHSARLQRSEILEECEPRTHGCYTLQSVEKVMKKGIHCVLPLGLDCVRRLHRFNIFPIIIFISQNARSTRKLKSKLQRHSQLEEQVLACSRSEEPLLDKLPCLYHRVSPDSWCDQTSLLTNLRTVICVEQRKIVWVEPELW
ncbi:caspase recruitment domain-containing protein 14 [Gouania willdenowi]|uniref:CARD domain-containing protein n=1 Tax=Gouania willdenowi TaxID=441366 RepID=A0A8C5GJZ6_GOUWI|nr:caspase recruitment domain-containing protein 14 [Gouania willdenowi]